MTGQRRLRPRLATLAIGMAMSTVGLTMAAAIPVAAADTVSLDVSWTRPGVPDPMSAPSALRVGDTVTVQSSSSGLAHPGCQVLFAAAGMQGNEPYMLVVHAAAYTSVCPAWTFVVPPAPPGAYVFRAAAWDPVYSQAEIPVTLEAGGTHVPFTSTFPVSSWAPADTVATEPLSFGDEFTVDVPAGLTSCEYDISGLPWSGFKTSDAACSDWTATLADTRPEVSTSGPFAAPYASHLFVDGHGVAAGRAFEVKSFGTDLAIEGDGGDPFASSTPAATFPAATNPYFVPAGSVALTPALVGIDSGTCEFLLKSPSASPLLPAGTVDVVDGQCEPNVVDAEEPGTYLMDVRVKDGSTTITEAWGGFVVTEPIPAPAIALPADPPLIGVDVPIGISVPTGVPTTYSIGITPGSPDCTGDSGTLDAMHATRVATATCRFDAAGSYQIDATMTDALGTTTHSTRTLTVVAEDTTAPSVTLAPTTFVTGGIVNSGKVPARFAWHGADAGSGVAGYDVELQTDGGAYARLATGTTATSLLRSMAPGHRYRVRVRATDHATNVSAWALGPSSSVTSRQETSTAIRWHGTWHTATSTSYWGGHQRYATQAGATASITFTGRAFTWVGAVGPTRGTARVYVNGTYVKSVDLHATTAVARRLVYSVAWSTAASRTITIRISGTAGHPRGDIDAFVTGS